MGHANSSPTKTYLALSSLPHIPESSLRPLVEVSDAAVAQGGVALGLVQRVLTQSVGAVLEIK